MASIPKPIRQWIADYIGGSNVPEQSGDVVHDDTQGGTTGNPHADSAASTDVSSIQGSEDVQHDNTQGGTTGNPHSESASDTDLSNHEGAGNPHSSSASTNHGNSAHSDTYVNATEAGAAAPVQSVNGDTGDVSVAGWPFELVMEGTVGSIYNPVFFKWGDETIEIWREGAIRHTFSITGYQTYFGVMHSTHETNNEADYKIYGIPN